ncbi:MAG: hypothetical protein ACR2GN_05350 [Bacteroidia bacterium]
MAEEETVIKTRNPWPWIIGILLFVVISWALYEYLRKSENPEDSGAPYIRESVIRDSDDNSKSTPGDTMELEESEID